MPYKLSMALSVILGILAMVVGATVMAASLLGWEPARNGLLSIAEGLRSANAAVELLGGDFGSSSSLFAQVGTSVRNTARVVRETGETVDEICRMTENMRGMILVIKESLENLPPGITAMMGRNYFDETIYGLDNTFYSSGELVTRLEHLSGTLEPVEPVLNHVADQVDSLAADLFSTEEAFGEAVTHLEKAAAALEDAARSRVLPMLLLLAGAIPLLVGIHLLLQAAMLKRIYSERAQQPSGDSEQSD